MSNHLITGKIGEKKSIQYLIEEGYSIIEINYRSKQGEIDIIAMDKDILVFIEVKTRKGRNYGYAFEAVNYSKQRRIINSAYMYLQKNKLNDTQVRFDIIEVYPNEKDGLNHFKNAFQEYA